MKYLLSLVALVLALSIQAQEQDITKKAQKLADELYKIKSMGGDHLGFSKEGLRILKNHFQVEPKGYVSKSRHYRTWRSRRRELEQQVDVFSILSGGLAIRESLQLDRISAIKPGQGTIDISTLKAPQIKSHPFEEMLGKRKWHSFELASYAPYDFYYFHFNNTKRVLDFLDYVDQVGGSIHKRFSPNSIDFRVKQKILKQLALQINKMTRPFYDSVIEEMAIVGSDPFVMEGSDVTILYKLKRPMMFKMTIGMYRMHFRNHFKAKTFSLNIAGMDVEHLANDSRTVNSYLLYLPDGTVALSNSQKAIEIIIQTYNKKRKSLFDLAEFRYMRSIYAANPQSEDGFLYLSDPFIRYLVGPELRIKEARRMAEAIRVATLERYTILYKQLYGIFPKNIEEMVTAIKGNSLEFAGLEIISNTFSARSKAYGRIGYFTPNLETQLAKVSKDEAKAYNRFSKTYTSYWNTYFDPIGIRIKMRDSVKIETCILPLINTSIYDSITKLLGGAPIELSNEGLPEEVFSFALKLNKKGFEKEFRQMSRNFKRLESQTKIPAISLYELFDDKLEIHSLDSRPTVDFEGSALIRDFLRISSRLKFEEMGMMMLAYSIFRPLRLSIGVNDEEKAEKLLQALDQYLVRLKQELKERRYSWWNNDVDHYGLVYKEKKFRAVKISFGNILHFRLFYGVHRGKLHITTTQDYMHKVFSSSPVKKNLGKANIKFVFRPFNLQLERDAYETSVSEGAKEASFKNFGTIYLLSKLFPNEKDLPQKCAETFGFKPISPVGGTYIIKNSVVADSLLGTSQESVLDIEKIRETSGMKRFFSTKNISLSLRFTPEGIMTVVEVK